MSESPLLKVEGIAKTFGSLRAVDSISFEARRGEALCVLGENGAGKTTLMNMLYGLYRPDSGRMTWKGEETRITSPRQALGLGIGMVHQRFMLVPTLTVTENILLSLKDAPKILNLAQMAKKIEELSERFELRVNPHALVADLSLGERQRVEILKNIAHDADLLILDEPTSVLTPQEVDGLWATLKRLRDGGMTLMPITHKLPEVRAIADRVVVLRGGKLVGSWNNDEVSDEELVNAIVRSALASPSVDEEAGQAAATEQIVGAAEVVEQADPTPSFADAETVVELEAVSTNNQHVNLEAVDLTVRRGELVGIAGVDGNGQTALARVLADLDSPSKGRVIRHTGTDSIGFVPADRIGMSLVGNFTLTENLLLRRLEDSRWRHPKLPLISWGRVTEKTGELIEEYGIKGRANQQARELSGGNQQKMAMARETFAAPSLLVIEQPTQGLDIGATAAVIARVRELASEGAGVVWISSNLDELIGECDRILVLYQGTVAGEVIPSPDAVAEAGRLMLGSENEGRG